MIYATEETEHRERSVHLVESNKEVGIIAHEGDEYEFYANSEVPLNYELLQCIANFLRTINVCNL